MFDFDKFIKECQYKCDFCGYKEDRDVNAAKNLKDYGEIVLASSM